MTSRLRLLLLLAFAFTGAEPLFAQQRRPMPAPTLLKGPVDWRFEHLPIPPGFAPDITWKGYEEARFAPGMFDTSSTIYFTYVLAVSVEGTNAIAAPELKDFLDKYFKGLSTGVGRRKGITPDPTQFNAEIVAVKAETPTPARFTGKVPYFDTFNDGRKILLNVEIEVQPRPMAKRTFVVLLISPQAKASPVWEKLRAIGKTVELP